MLRRRPEASRVGLRRPSAAAHQPADVPREDALRAVLVRDPNDVVAFDELADLVRRRTVASKHAALSDDALRGELPIDPAEEAERAADDAVWALAEELAGNPRAWHPLVKLARLSVHDDRDGAMRRLATAAERDPTGEALAAGVLTLREAGLPADALALGVGHWRPNEHTPLVGKQVVRAAVESGRLGEAKRHLAALEQHPEAPQTEEMRAELAKIIEQASEGWHPTI